MNGLPAGWAETTLGQLGDYLNGRGFKKSEWRESGRPIIRIQNLTGTSDRFNHFDGEPDDHYLARRGDILVSWAATLGVFVWDGPEAVVNQHIFKVRSRIDPQFHRYLLASVLGDLRRQTHGSGMVHITKSRFEHTRVLLPPLGEQRRIVAAIEKQFSRLDAGLLALERVGRNLEAMRGAVLDATMAGRLISDPARQDSRAALHELLERRRAESTRARSRYREPLNPLSSKVRLPDHWIWASLDMLAASDEAITDGPFGSNLKTAHYTESGPRVIRLQNVGDGEFIDAEAHISLAHYQRLERYAVEPGDLVAALLGETLPRACVVPADLGLAIVKADCPRLRLSPLVNPRFVWAVLNAPATQAETSARVHGVGRPRLNLTELREIAVPLPPRPEQDTLVAAMESNLSEIEHLRAVLIAREPAYHALRSAILATAFSGKLVAQDPSDPSADVLLHEIREAQAGGGKVRSRTRRHREKVGA